jgi:hypothetical protein
MSRGGYVLVGVLLGSVLAPAAVYATASIVNVAGPSGRKAEVSTANQLQVVESSPGAYFESGYLSGAVSSCRTIATPPSGKALVISQLSVLVQTLPSADSAHGYLFYRNKTCDGAISYLDFPARIGETTHDFRPGITSKSGFSILLFGTGTQAEAEVRGYTVPASAVP